MDIEDVIRFGYEKHICPYYYQRAIAGKVDLVLMPYNYIIEPGMAKWMNVNMEGSIIIFDEAHNIENTAEDGCSLEVTNSNLTTAL